MTKLIECARCLRERPHRARQMCASCYINSTEGAKRAKKRYKKSKKGKAAQRRANEHNLQKIAAKSLLGMKEDGSETSAIIATTTPSVTTIADNKSDNVHNREKTLAFLQVAVSQALCF